MLQLFISFLKFIRCHETFSYSLSILILCHLRHSPEKLICYITTVLNLTLNALCLKEHSYYPICSDSIMIYHHIAQEKVSVTLTSLCVGFDFLYISTAAGPLTNTSWHWWLKKCEWNPAIHKNRPPLRCDWPSRASCISHDSGETIGSLLNGQINSTNQSASLACCSSLGESRPGH